jgi:DNA-binding transcriptional MerR regulator
MKSQQRSKTSHASSASIESSSPYPDPRELLIEAQSELANKDLSQYADVIRTLREKGFSFREIAQWLSKRGVPTDHNGVYRVFTTALHPGAMHDAEEQARRQLEE